MPAFQAGHKSSLEMADVCVYLRVCECVCAVLRQTDGQTAATVVFHAQQAAVSISFHSFRELRLPFNTHTHTHIAQCDLAQ